MHKNGAVLGLLLVAFMWGINPAIMKIGLPYIPPAPYNSLRMLMAIVLGAVLLLFSKQYRPVEKHDIKDFVLVSVAGFFVFQLFFTVGVQNTTAGNASVLLGLLPVSVAIINRVFGIEKISGSTAAGVVISAIGVILMVAGSGKEISLAGSHWKGAMMLLVAQIGYGYYTVFSRPLTQKYSSYQVTAYVITISGFLFVLVSIPEMLEISWREIPLNAWLSTLYSGVFALCIANFLWIWGVGKVGSSKAAVFNNLSPIFAVTSGFFMLGETIAILQFIGAIVILGGVYITRVSNIKASDVQRVKTD